MAHKIIIGLFTVLTLFFAVIFIGFLILCLSFKDEKNIIQNTEKFRFPKIDWIDPATYNQIKETCRTYWDLNNMIADTFEIKKLEGIG